MEMIEWTEIRMHRNGDQIAVEVMAADGKSYVKQLTNEEAVDFSLRLLEQQESLGPDGTLLVTFRPDEEYQGFSDSPGHK